MRILVCNWKDLTHPGAGGAEVYTEECTRRWAASGHEVTLFCASVAGQPETEWKSGYRIVRAGSRIGVYGAARRFVRAHAADFDVIVDEINTRPFFAFRDAGRTPVVALAHQVAREVWFHETPLPVALAGRFALEPWWLRAYAHVNTLTVSASSAESLRQYGLQQVSVVPEGVELPTGVSTRAAKAAVPTLAFCGRLVSMKRPDHVVAAFARACSSMGDGAELHIIGAGPLEQKLRRDAPPGVVLHGHVGQLEKFEILGRAHALVAASMREGWGLVVSEAAAVGTPTIAYDVAGLRDSVSAANGVLVAPNVGALAEGIAEWLPQFRARPPAPLPYGGAASWDHVADVILQHLDKAAGQSAARPTRVLAEAR